MDEHEHFGPECPECQAATQTCQVLGGIAEAMQKMLDDGTFERLGAEMAYRREQAILDALLKA